MENLDLIYSLFNQHLFQDAKNNIESLEYYFNTNPSTSNNPLVQALLGAIKDYNYDSIDIPLFRSILTKDGKNQVEQDQIIGDILRYKGYNKTQIAPAKEDLKGLLASTLINRAVNRFSGDPFELYKYVKNSDLKIDNSDLLSSKRFCDFDINKMVDEENVKGYPSTFSWINNLFEPGHMYEAGQMALICSPPGTGKTLWMMTEALNMALTTSAKIHYLAMGDMKPRDFIIRMGAIYTGKTFGEVTSNLKAVYAKLSEQIQDRLEISVVPAGQVTVDDYVEYVRSKNFDVVFIDYDSNFKLKESESMYNDFGIVYNELTKLTQDGRLVFIAAQPKVNVWSEPVIELGSVGESARKIHTVDILFTAGKYKDSPNHVGIFKCCKNRRGEEGGMIGYIRLGNGRFKFIPPDVARQLGAETVRKNYTEADIDTIVRTYEETLYRSSGRMSGSASKASKINNPFK